MIRFGLLFVLALAAAAQPTVPPGSGTPPSTVNPALTPYAVRGATSPPSTGCAYWSGGRVYSTGSPCGEDASVAWADVTGKPETFAPAAHASAHASLGLDPLTLAIAQITGLQAALDAKTVGPSGAPTDGQMALFDGITGRLLKAFGLTGVVKVTNGVPGVVAGDAANCVRVDGSSGACGTGGSPGESWSGSLNLVEVGTGSTTIQAARVGTGTFAASGATVGTGLAPIWPDMEAGLVPIAMRVVSADTIRVWVWNESNTAIDPVSATFGATAQGGLAAGGDSTVVANSGASGASVLKAGTNVTARKIKAGANVTVTENTDDIEIASTGGGGTGLPDMTGHVGKLITNDGVSTASWETQEGGAGILITQVAGKKIYSVRSEVVGFLGSNNAWNGQNAFSGKIITTPSATQTLVASDPISIVATSAKQISAASGITLTSAPTIADGTDGQHVLLINVGDFSIVLQDEASLASSNLCTISDANLTVPSKGTVHLMFNAAAACWIEVK